MKISLREIIIGIMIIAIFIGLIMGIKKWGNSNEITEDYLNTSNLAFTINPKIESNASSLLRYYLPVRDRNCTIKIYFENNMIEFYCENSGGKN